MRSIYDFFRRQKTIKQHQSEMIEEEDEQPIVTAVDSGERMDYEPDEVEFDDEFDDEDDDDDEDDYCWGDEDNYCWGDDDEDDDEDDDWD